MSANPELPWIAEARRHIGLAEIAGPKHNQTIIKWLKDLKSSWLDDETAWCGTFVAHCLQTAGFQRGSVNSRSKTYKSGTKAPPGFYPFNWYAALEYIKEGGVKLDKPCYGCVAVKSREGGGHVTFVVGKTPTGKLICLGGNQSNKVCFAVYDVSAFEAFMWYGKTSKPAAHRYDLPVLKSFLLRVFQRLNLCTYFKEQNPSKFFLLLFFL